LFLSVVVVAGVALPQVEACRYWCDNPNTDAIDYVCCDDGNPWYRGAAVPDDTDAEDVEVVPAEVANDARPSGCMYYCLYNNESYCCHSSEDGAPPADHEENAGRCPTEEEEQSCKAPFSADKKAEGKTKRISSVFVGKHDKMCASDGYCAEEEKCCPNKCHKIHTCMPSF